MFSCEKRWRLRECCQEVVARLEAEGFQAPLAVILAVRGIDTAESARFFINPSLLKLENPFLLKGMSEAVERLVKARQEGETICIHGDYDVDGVTATALLERLFAALEIPACHVIPLRLEDGYGLSTDGVDEALALGAKLLITVDCGITSIEEARYCREKGIDLVITDHHTPSGTLPDALAVINPLQPGCSSVFKGLAGVGLALKLAMAVRSRMRELGFFEVSGEPNLADYLDLAALGTIADLVPLSGDNRTIAFFGLSQLTKSVRPGVVALKEVSAVKGDVSSGDVGFRLAPRLNAAGRLDDAKLGVKLLLTDDSTEAGRIARELDSANQERQEIERQIFEEAVQMVTEGDLLQKRITIVLASEKWHPGVIGIVASRLVERFHRPTVLIALDGDEGRGSGRSIPSFHLYNGIAAASEALIKFGGHSQAAGLTISRPLIDRFYELFDIYAAATLTTTDLIPEIVYDVEVKPEQLTEKLISLASKMRPFGMGNPEPVYLLKNVRVVSSRVLKDIHLKLMIESGGSRFDAIGFRMAGKMPESGFIDILFSPEMNIWNGRERIQLRIRDLKVSNGAE